MRPEAWHRSLCSVVGPLSLAISRRRVPRSRLAEWAAVLRDVASLMEEAYAGTHEG